MKGRANLILYPTLDVVASGWNINKLFISFNKKIKNGVIRYLSYIFYDEWRTDE